jgi:hypothetical protein
MIKPKLTFFQVQMERGLAHATKPTESCFGIAPKTLNTINVRLFLDKLIASMVDAKMFLVPQINQAIIPSPSIRMNNTFQLYTPPDDGLERLSGTVGDDFSINLPIAFENAKDNCLAQCTSSSFTLNTTSTKVTFINFNLTIKG